MRDDLRHTGATASFAASLSMALLAAAALANAGGLVSPVQLIFVVVLSIAATAMSVLLLRFSTVARHSQREAAFRRPALVPVRAVRVRERLRRTE